MKTDVVDAPTDSSSYEFEIGQWYRRGGLHDTYKGSREKGISGPADHPVIFIFKGEGGKRGRYDDTWLDNDRLRFTGVGLEGDQSMTGENRRLKNHQEEGRDVHVFEEVRSNPHSIVSYVGEYDLERIEEAEREDRNGDLRRVFQFILMPFGEPREIDVEEESLEGLFRTAKEAANYGGALPNYNGGDGGVRPRSEHVRRFALAHANEICQGCGQDAPFEKSNGEKYLEVHHLYRLSDEGVDDPENVIALCPNCHRRRHEGKDGDEFNEQLIKIAEERNQQFR